MSLIQKEDEINSSVTVSKAGRRHAEKIVDLLLAAWIHTYPNEQFHIRKTDVREKFGDINRKVIRIGKFLDSIRELSEITYLVAEKDGNVSGFLYALNMNRELYINALYVHPDRQRAGIGNLLLQKGITLNQGMSRVIVDVVAYNGPAVAFYKKHGFLVQGPSETPFGKFPNGIVVPEIRMVKNCVRSNSVVKG